MKNYPFSQRSIIIAAAIFCSFQLIWSLAGKIKGRVQPSNVAVMARAISMSDTFSVNILNGSFELRNVKAGIYSVYIEAIPPYRSAIIPGVHVQESTTTELGTIQLESDTKH